MGGEVGSERQVFVTSEAAQAELVGPSQHVQTAPAPRSRSKSVALRILGILALTILIAVPTAFGGIRLWALHHLSSGRDELDRYHHKAALAHFQACLKVRSNDPEALLLAARTQRRLGAQDEAERLLDRYQQAVGTDDALTLERVLMRADRGDTDAVATYCQELVKRDSQAAPLILEALTHGYMVRYRWLEAQACLRLWFELRPNDTQALFFQGSMDAFRDKQQEALASYRRALELDATRDDTRVRLADLLLDQSRFDEALPLLEDLHQRQPDDRNIAVSLGRCYDQIGRQDDAVKLVDDVLSHLPRFAPALYLRGLLAVRKGDWGTAEKWLRQACESGPGDFRAHYQLSQCLEHQGKEAEARALQPKLDQIEADTRRVHDIVVMQMPLTPHDPALHLEVGLACLRVGEDADGLGWLSQALKEDPDHKPTHEAFADYYEKHGNTALAARHRERAKPAAGR